MNLPALAIEKKPVIYFAVFLLVFGGIFCYSQLGQLEDPEFTVKTAAIITTYPGAIAEVVFEIPALLVRQNGATKLAGAPVLSGVVTGLVVMYATALLV